MSCVSTISSLVHEPPAPAANLTSTKSLQSCKKLWRQKTASLVEMDRLSDAKKRVSRPISTDDLKQWITNACGAWKLERMPWPDTTNNLAFEGDCPRSGASHYRQIWMPALAKLLLPTDDDHNEILDTAKELSAAVIELYKTLKEQMCGNVDAISKVWRAMTPRERRELLSAVWSDIPVHRR